MGTSTMWKAIKLTLSAIGAIDVRKSSGVSPHSEVGYRCRRLRDSRVVRGERAVLGLLLAAKVWSLSVTLVLVAVSGFTVDAEPAESDCPMLTSLFRETLVKTFWDGQ